MRSFTEKLKKAKENKKGFTLVEIIVVLVIIGILASLMLGALNGYIDKAKEKGIYHLHFTMDDNFALSPKTKDKFRRMFSGVFFRRFIRGEWAATDGLVYQQFADVESFFNELKKLMGDRKK